MLRYAAGYKKSRSLEEALALSMTNTASKIPSPPKDYIAGTLELTLKNEGTEEGGKEVAARSLLMKGHNDGGEVWAHNAYPYHILPKCTHAEL